MNLTYTIARYEYLTDGRFLVAFNIKDNLENSAYVESELKSSDISGKSTQEVCQLAFNAIKDKIDQIKENFEVKHKSAVGYQFIPE